MRWSNSVNSAQRLCLRRKHYYSSLNYGRPPDDVVFHPGVVHEPDERAPLTKRTPEWIRKSRKRKLEIPLPAVTTFRTIL